jgi:methylenetetrahydrofolate reductase (NADPH)
VAAFPEAHPSAESVDADARVLAAKAKAGAEFAITQLFFRADDYFRLVDRVAALGVDMPIIPGIMPITNLAQITRMAELSGAALPPEIVERVGRFEGDPVAVRAEGIALATELCDTLLAGGAPGLHFYTLNRSKATREIYAGLRGPAGS